MATGGYATAIQLEPPQFRPGPMAQAYCRRTVEDRLIQSAPNRSSAAAASCGRRRRSRGSVGSKPADTAAVWGDLVETNAQVGATSLRPGRLHCDGTPVRTPVSCGVTACDSV